MTGNRMARGPSCFVGLVWYEGRVLAYDNFTYPAYSRITLRKVK
jgi:hypothetical protein